MPENSQSGNVAARPLCPSSPWLARHPALALGLVVAVFASVRLACLFNDLWLDEIWSLSQVATLGSPGQILTHWRHDNNHPLNSFFLYLLVPAKADWLYRLFPWFTGSCTVWLAAKIGRLQFRPADPDRATEAAGVAELFGAVLVGGSYLLIHYSSEARGYAPVTCFSLLAFYALLRGDDNARVRWPVLYWLACMLALLSHLVAVQVLLAGLVFSFGTLLPETAAWRARGMRLAFWHLPPAMFFCLYYLGFVRKLETGGGPEVSLLTALGDLAAYTVGLPVGAGLSLALPLLLLVTAGGLVLLWRSGKRALAAFYLTLVFLSPALGLFASHFTLFHPRFFIVSAAGALLLAGYGLAWMWSRGPSARWAISAILALFLIGNGLHTRRLLHDGRGQYQAALRSIAEQTPTPVITVASDNDFRNFPVLDYYSRAAGPGRSLRYYPHNRWSAEGPQWLLLHRLDGETAPGGGATDLRMGGHHFRLAGVFPHAALSGWDWFVYRNADLLP